MADQSKLNFQDKKRLVPDDLARRAPESNDFTTVLRWRLLMIRKYGTSVPERYSEVQR